MYILYIYIYIIYIYIYIHMYIYIYIIAAFIQKGQNKLFTLNYAYFRDFRDMPIYLEY